jgi:hypothetical protein
MLARWRAKPAMSLFSQGRRPAPKSRCGRATRWPAANGMRRTIRMASHNYFLLEKFEAGVALRGTEVKSIREGQANLKDSYGLIRTARRFCSTCISVLIPTGIWPTTTRPARANCCCTGMRFASYSRRRRSRAHAHPHAALLPQRAGQVRAGGGQGQAGLGQAGDGKAARGRPRGPGGGQRQQTPDGAVRHIKNKTSIAKIVG